MDYIDIEKKFISEILKDKKKCIDTINENKDVIIKYLRGTEKPIYITELVNKLNDIIVNKLKKFKIIEKVLKHELFIKVLEEFRKSDVLIKAMRNKKTDAVKWLLTMDMNYYVQDEKGTTAFIEASKSLTYLFVMKEILKNNEDILNITDDDGNLALFYASNIKIFSLLCEIKIDFNHINNEGDTVLINCCKQKICPNFKEILTRMSEKKIDHVNKEGKTALMYLVEFGNYDKITILCKDYKSNINFKNKNNETAVTVLMNKFKKMYLPDNSGCFLRLNEYVNTMNTLVKLGANFNVAIDEDGNTPIMYFIMIGDYFATTYLLEKCENLDLSVRNVYGISASYLLFWIRPKEQTLLEMLVKHKSFDSDSVDDDNNNLIMHILFRRDLKYLNKALEKKKIFNHVNNKNENELIIATKLGVLCKELFKSNEVNQQDYLGNTALYYAIKLKDREAINMLVYHKADPTIKNYQGVSAIDLADQMKEEFIFEILKNPMTPEQMKTTIEKEGKVFGVFNKKKSTDDKLVDYIKKYQIKNYKEEYDNFIKNEKRSYSYVEADKSITEKLASAYMNLYSTKAPNAMVQIINEEKDAFSGVVILV